jgi:hypothetical protein
MKTKKELGYWGIGEIGLSLNPLVPQYLNPLTLKYVL